MVEGRGGEGQGSPLDASIQVSYRDPLSLESMTMDGKGLGGGAAGLDVSSQ